METKIGLPSSCHGCGKPITANETWFARNKDEARSGKGLCPDCVVSESAPKAAPEQEQLPNFLLPKDNLTKISGLGTTSAKKLEMVDVLTFADLARSNAVDLAHATGIKETKLTQWIEAANDL